MSSAPNHVAVYGTLRRGLEADTATGLSTCCECVGLCRLRGTLHDLGPYPGLVEGEGEVVAEVYRLDDPRLLAVLDEYEGFLPGDPRGSLYLRRAVQPLDFAAPCWVYFFNRDPAGSPIIASGDWTRR